MKKPLFYFLALSSYLISINTFALSTDRDQPANIEADDIEFDFKKGTRTYIGNVFAEQGTLKLKADKFLAIYKNDKLKTATAWGSLARFRQRPDGKEHDVEGWAKKIIVNQSANTLTLIGKAAIKQGTDTAHGDTIIYNMATDKLQIKGKANVGNKTPKPTANKTNKTTTSKQEAFKDNPDGPAEQTTDKSPVIQKSNSGRSRLIITPQ